VFEGLDRSGKSTQIKRLSALGWAMPGPEFIHMPTGMTDLTRNIYALTENSQISSPLARQLLHMACPAENIGPIAEARACHGQEPSGTMHRRGPAGRAGRASARQHQLPELAGRRCGSTR
jgi:hypothetical protein